MTVSRGQLPKTYHAKRRVRFTWPLIIANPCAHQRYNEHITNKSSALQSSIVSSYMKILKVQTPKRNKTCRSNDHRTEPCAKESYTNHGPNQGEPSYGSHVSGHITDSESTKHKNEMKLTKSVILTPTHVQTEATQTKRPNQEALV